MKLSRLRSSVADPYYFDTDPWFRFMQKRKRILIQSKIEKKTFSSDFNNKIIVFFTSI